MLRGTLQDLNNSISQDLKIETVTFKQFKELHKNDDSMTFDSFVARISKVERIENGFEMHFVNGRWARIWYDGTMQKNEYKPVKHYDKGRIRMNQIDGYYNSSVCPEKLIGICDCILEDTLPSKFDLGNGQSLVVNIMDGTGNLETSMELGVQMDLHENNLEWTTNKHNFCIHGRNIKRLFRMTKHVYRFSANDKYLFDAVALNNVEKVKAHLEANYELVK